MPILESGWWYLCCSQASRRRSPDGAMASQREHTNTATPTPGPQRWGRGPGKCEESEGDLPRLKLPVHCPLSHGLDLPSCITQEGEKGRGREGEGGQAEIPDLL